MSTLNRVTDVLVMAAGIVALHVPVACAAGDPGKGRTKAQTCVACHGLDGLSRRPDAPNIAGQIAYYLREQLVKYRSGERTHPEMNIVAGALSDADIDDLAAYYSSIEITVTVPE